MDLGDVELFAKRVDVVVENVFFDDRPSLACLVAAESAGDGCIGLGERGSPVPLLEFDPVVASRIVARRHHDATEELPARHGERDGLRRRGSFGENHPITGGAKRLCDHPGELARQKTSIESHHHRVAIDSCRRLQVPRSNGDRVSDALHVLEGEEVGDDRSPSVGSEGDHRFAHCTAASTWPGTSAPV